MAQPTEATAAQPTEFETLQAHIKAVCDEAGLGVMVQVFEIIHDREAVSDERLLALTADDVDAFYTGWLARAIDNIESSLLGDFD